MSGHSDIAKQRNAKLFENFRQKLSTREAYIEFSDRLRRWANDQRAYYDDYAKTTIIELLERALMTLKEILGVSTFANFNVQNHPDNSYTSAFKNLVETVNKFQDRFSREHPHPSLHARLQALYLTTTPPEEIIDVDAMNIEELPPAPQNKLQSIPDHRESPSPSDSTEPPRLSVSVAPARPTPPMSVPTTVAVEKTPSSTNEEQKTVTSVPSKPKKKKKEKSSLRRQLEDLELQSLPPSRSMADVQQLRGSETNASIFPAAPPIHHHEGKGEFSVKPEPVQSSVATTAVLPEGQGSRSASSAFKSQSPALNYLSRSSASHSPSPNFLDRALMSPSPLHARPIAALPILAPVEKQSTQNTSEVALRIDMPPSPPHAHPTAAALPTLPPVEKQSAQNTGESSEVASRTDMHTSTFDDAMKVDSKLPVIENVVQNISVDTMEIDDVPSTEVEKPSLIAKPVLISLPSSAGLDRTQVTKRLDGSNGHTDTNMIFAVNEEQFGSIENWNHRLTTPIRRDRRYTLCFSLACYSRVELEKNADNYNAIRSRWPRGQKLHLNVTKRDGTNRRILLGPPTACTPDGFVDLNPYIRQGRNTIQISQIGDFSAFVFCLHVHQPTLAQIQKLNKTLQENIEWKEWCQVVSGPLHLPPSKFSQGL